MAIKMKRNALGLLLATLILTTILTTANSAIEVKGSIKAGKWRKQGWMKIENDIITIIFPARGRHPIVIWYYNKDNTTINVVHFKGIWEYLTINLTELTEFKRNLNLTANLINRTIIARHIDYMAKKIREQNELELKLNETLREMDLQARLDDMRNIILNLHSKMKHIEEIRHEIRNITESIRVVLSEVFTHLNEFNQTLDKLNEKSRQHGCDITENMDKIKGRIRDITVRLTELIIQLENATINRMREISREIGLKINETTSMSMEIEEETWTINQIINLFFQHIPIPSQIKQLLSKCLNETIEIIQEIYKMKLLTHNLTGKSSEISNQTNQIPNQIEILKERLWEMIGKVNRTYHIIRELTLNDTELKLILNMTLNLSLNANKTLKLIEDLNKTLNLNVTRSLQITSKIHENMEEIISEINRCRERIRERINMARQLQIRIRDKIRQLIGLTQLWHTNWHPPLFNFASGIWNLTEISNITSTEGEIIGLTFLYKLTKVQNPKFKFLEDNLMLRCRFYYVPVEEQMNNIIYTVTRAELKVDFILNNWEWILDSINQTLENQFNITINGVEGLALWIDISSLNSTKLRQIGETIDEAAIDMERASAKASILTNINAVGEGVNVNVNVKINATMKLEKPLITPRKIGAPIKLKFISEDRTIGGFFKFINTAKITYPNGTERNIDVKASYLEAGGLLRIYLCYPYFDNATLQHDPSIGLEIEEEKPIYTVEIPRAGELKPKSALMIMTLTPSTTSITTTRGEKVTIKITAEDSIGKPVEEAEVRIEIAGETYKAKSIGGGEYEAEISTQSLEVGEYIARVYAEKEGYSIAEASITVIITPRHLIIEIETIIITAATIGAITMVVIITRRRITKT